MASEGEHTFQSKNLQIAGYMFFRNIKHSEEFCDLTFHIGGKTILAHHIIVAAAIPYYRKFMSNKNGAANGDEKGFIMPDGIDPGAFENLIEFAYSGEVVISDENVKRLLSVAWHLDVKEVIEACCDFLINTLNPKNVFQIRDFARNLEYTDFLKEIDDYICENFSKISQMEEFSSLPLQCVEELLGRDDLRVSSEEMVFISMMKWVKKCPEQRKANLPELLKKVRMTLLEPRFLKDCVASDYLVHESIPCRDLLDEARNYHFFPDDRTRLNSFSVERRCKALCTSSAANDESIYVFSGSFKYTAQHFSQREQTWKTEGSKNLNHVISSSTVVDGRIYYLHRQQITEYNPLKNQYKVRKGFHRSMRRLYGVTSVSGKIYVCGGRNDSTYLKTVECYDPANDVWGDLSDMRECRSSPGVTALGECIYVVGGKADTSVHRSAEKYDLRSGKWRAVTSMLMERYDFGCTTLNGRIYACGGVTTGGVRTPTAEVYDPIENEWMSISSVSIAGRSFKLLPYYGKLCKVGGKDKDGSYIYTVEIYDPETDKWKFDLKMNHKFLFATAEVISSAYCLESDWKFSFI